MASHLLEERPADLDRARRRSRLDARREIHSVANEVVARLDDIGEVQTEAHLQ